MHVINQKYVHSRKYTHPLFLLQVIIIIIHFCHVENLIHAIIYCMQHFIHYNYVCTTKNWSQATLHGHVCADIHEQVVQLQRSLSFNCGNLASINDYCS